MKNYEGFSRCEEVIMQLLNQAEETDNMEAREYGKEKSDYKMPEGINTKEKLIE